MRHRGTGGIPILVVIAASLILAFQTSAASLADQPSAARPQSAQNPQGAGKPAGQGGQNAQGPWPRKIPLGQETLIVEAPLADSLEGTKLAARSAARLQSADGANSSSGTIWYEAEVQVDRDKRIVSVTTVTVPKVQFVGLPPARLQKMSERLTQAAGRWNMKLPLDDILASARMAKIREAAPPKLNTDPPKIVIETEPAILLMFDGEPRFRAVEGTHMERALNTPFLVLHDASASAYYLSGGTAWFGASSPTGPWAKIDKAPAEAVQIASKDLKDAGVAQSDVDQAKQTADKRVPKIVVATEPTELIVSDGPPQWIPLVAGQLETPSNCTSDLFRTLPDQHYYVVLSGRWYRSDAYSGPWTYVAAGELPDSFRRIPSDSDKADALTFVPGTAAAQDAVADANKPRTAGVKRSEAHLSVTYDGDPKFEAIPNTHVEYAVNTPDQVLKIRGRFYACDQGVWFTADAPTGPWVVADSIPDEDIATIPPESPVYSTRYVTVYDSTPALVYTAYTPAYLGSYPWGGAVVFGTGWAYRPWWGAYYYPRPWTWGFGPRFALWGGGWGFGFGWGGAWAGWRYGFGYGWGARWMGPGGWFHPGWRNASITRNVNITRNVTRNVYNQGANKNRATTQQGKTANASKQGAGQSGKASTQAAKSGKGAGKPAGQGAKGQGQANKGGGKASPGHAAGHPAGGHAAGGHGGGHGGKK